MGGASGLRKEVLTHENPCLTPTSGQSFGLAFDSVGKPYAADTSDQTIYTFTSSNASTISRGPQAASSFRVIASVLFTAIDFAQGEPLPLSRINLRCHILRRD